MALGVKQVRKKRVGFVERVFQGLNAPKKLSWVVLIGGLTFLASSLAGNAIYALTEGLPPWQKYAVAFAPFPILVLLLYRVGRSIPTRAQSLGIHKVERKSALVASLSNFGPLRDLPLSANPCRSLDELREFASELEQTVNLAKPEEQTYVRERARRQFWDRVAVTNLGPLVLALFAHGDRLRKLRLCVTDRTGGQFPLVAEALNKLWPGVAILATHLGDATNVKSMVAILAEDLDRLLGSHLGDSGRGIGIGDIAVDFTGGTAAMSAAMNIAALDERFVLEYVKQGPEFGLFDAETGAGRDPEELVRLKVIVEVQTGRHDVPLIVSEGCT